MQATTSLADSQIGIFPDICLWTQPWELRFWNQIENEKETMAKQAKLDRKALAAVKKISGSKGSQVWQQQASNRSIRFKTPSSNIMIVPQYNSLED